VLLAGRRVIVCKKSWTGLTIRPAPALIARYVYFFFLLSIGWEIGRVQLFDRDLAYARRFRESPPSGNLEVCARSSAP